MSCDCEKKLPKHACEPCKTINLALHVPSKNKACSPHPAACMQTAESVFPTAIKVCTREEQLGQKPTPCRPPRPPPRLYAHGPLGFVAKAVVLGGVIYWTWSQGIWGDQEETLQFTTRWNEYIKSLNTRVPPQFDKCGNVVVTENKSQGLFAPVYMLYKGAITTAFAGIVKFPTMVKCAYTEYLKALEQRRLEIERMKKIAK